MRTSKRAELLAAIENMEAVLLKSGILDLLITDDIAERPVVPDIKDVLTWARKQLGGVPIVKFDPNIPTLAGDTTQHVNAQCSGSLSQDHLDDILRKKAAPHAIEDMIKETNTAQWYRLSNGTLLKIIKGTGQTTRPTRIPR